MKETSANFILNVISVILGIAITFVIQGMINRAGDRKEVRSALELVRSELKTNIEDIGIMTDHLTQERQSAGYLLRNLPKIDKCPEDSVNHHCGIVFADASITLSNDALELLKMSSLFQKIGDNRLAMKIIRAYDTCGSAVSNLNRHPGLASLPQIQSGKPLFPVAGQPAGSHPVRGHRGSPGSDRCHRRLHEITV